MFRVFRVWDHCNSILIIQSAKIPQHATHVQIHTHTTHHTAINLALRLCMWTWEDGRRHVLRSKLKKHALRYPPSSHAPHICTGTVLYRQSVDVTQPLLPCWPLPPPPPRLRLQRPYPRHAPHRHGTGRHLPSYCPCPGACARGCPEPPCY